MGMGQGQSCGEGIGEGSWLSPCAQVGILRSAVSWTHAQVPTPVQQSQPQALLPWKWGTGQSDSGGVAWGGGRGATSQMPEQASLLL
jgi:hypothetical protein